MEKGHKMGKIYLLDCTLRDGGYVNDWKFSRKQYDYIVTKLEDASIDCIELGMMGSGSRKDFRTRFYGFEDIPVRGKKRNVIYAVMMTAGESDAVPIPPRVDGGAVDAVRLAFFKPDIDKAFQTAEKIKQNGYLLFMQAMATFMYTDDELQKLIQKVNQLQADAFYMVDSFGTMYPDEVIKMAGLADSLLDKETGFGFHAHNNRQLAFANDIAFAESLLKSGRREKIYVDASVFGMGRGAGNTPIELIAGYLNEKQGSHYNTDALMDIYQSAVREEYENKQWGYAMDYYMTSQLQMNSAYIWYIKTVKNICNFAEVRNILKRIPSADRYTLKKDIVNSILDDAYRQEK